MQPIRIAIGADGRGTTFEAIARAIANGKIDAIIVLLFTNNGSAPVVEKAKAFGISVAVLEGARGGKERNDMLYAAFASATGKIDLICLAGYLKRIPQCVIEMFPGRIINSHPAFDLTNFGGKGMYGARVTKAVIDAGLKETGSVIHVVSEMYDDPGGIIAETPPISILPNETPESLLHRQLPAEQALYLDVIQRFCKRSLP